MGNKLGITVDLFDRARREALEKRKLQQNEEEHQSVQRMIEVDLPRTFPRLSLFQKEGTFYAQVGEVLEAFAAYNPHLGYVQGMSFLAGMLMLHMDQFHSFQCLCNLLNNHFFISLYKLNIKEANKPLFFPCLLFQVCQPFFPVCRF